MSIKGYNVITRDDGIQFLKGTHPRSVLNKIRRQGSILIKVYDIKNAQS